MSPTIMSVDALILLPKVGIQDRSGLWNSLLYTITLHETEVDREPKFLC